MKAKDFKEVINNIPDDAEVLFLYSDMTFGENPLKPVMNKKDIIEAREKWEECWAEDNFEDYCDYLICF